MSNQAQTPTLNAEAAYNVLVAEVHAPVFFNKLASHYGITPQSPDEARELLLIAGQLRNAQEQDTVKQAQARGSYFAEARRDLNQVLSANGVQPIVAEDANVKRAAAEAARNPLLKEAALVFSNHLAQAAAGK